MAIVGNAVTLITLKALIHVTTKPGATVTFKKGSTTMGTKTANASGIAELEVLSGDWGSWSISASWSASGIAEKAEGSVSAFTISAATTYNKTITLKWYLIKNGDFCEGFNTTFAGNNPRSRFEHVNADTDYVWLTNDNQGQTALSSYASGYFTNGISMNDWKTMYISFSGRGESDYMGLVDTASGAEANFTNSVRIVYRQGPSYAGGTGSLDVSGVTGTKYVALRVHATYSAGYSNWPGDLHIYDLYLEC